jgi:hypothetical protein
LTDEDHLIAILLGLVAASGDQGGNGQSRKTECETCHVGLSAIEIERRIYTISLSCAGFPKTAAPETTRPTRGRPCAAVLKE